MGISHKLLVLAAVVCALAIAPVAYGSGGATATATPTHLKEGKRVTIKVTGMQAKEKVKFVELLPNGQKRTLYPRAGSTGVLIATFKVAVKGKHTAIFTGRSSHRKATTHFVVR